MSVIIGSLSFEYPKLDYQYKAVLTPEITQYKQIVPILATGTDHQIGSLVVDVERELLSDGTYMQQNTHTYKLPEGIIEFTYLTDNLSSTGGFKPDTIYEATIVSGSKNFLGSKGLVSLNTGNSNTRHVKIEFTY